MSTIMMRMNRCASLARTGDASMRSALHEALLDPEWPVRLAAVLALEDLRNPESVDHLLDLLEQEGDAPIYTQQGELVHVGAAQVSTPALDPLLGNASQVIADAWARRGRVRQAICLALGAIGIATPKVILALGGCAISALEDYPVRAAAARSLGRLGSPDALPFLLKAADDPEWCTRTEAQKSLRLIHRVTDGHSH